LFRQIPLFMYTRAGRKLRDQVRTGGAVFFLIFCFLIFAYVVEFLNDYKLNESQHRAAVCWWPSERQQRYAGPALAKKLCKPVLKYVVYNTEGWQFNASTGSFRCVVPREQRVEAVPDL